MEVYKTQVEDSRFRSFRSGFTLVELLVVIAIIAVLAALSMMGVAKMIEKSRQTQVLSQFKDLSAGLQSFITDNSRPPLPEAARESGTDTIFSGASSAEKNNFILGVLMPQDTQHFSSLQDQVKAVNPRAETYLNIPYVGEKKKNGMGKDGILYDPWGKEIVIALNAPPFADDSAEGTGGVKDRFMFTNNEAVYSDYKPREQDYVMWTYGKDGKKGNPASGPSEVVGLAGSDDVISFK